MIFSDIDGVLRDLCGAAGINPTTYKCTVGKDNLSFNDFFNENLLLLKHANVTEYFEVIHFFHNYISPVILLSAQPKLWEESTRCWIKRHFKDNFSVIFDSDKLRHLKERDILIEDSPLLSDYSQVFLIDRPYNRDLKLPHERIINPKQLFTELLWRERNVLL